MLITLIRLQLLKRIRSSSFARSMAFGIVAIVIGSFLLAYLFLIGLVLNTLVKEVMGVSDAVLVINSSLLYFYLLELIYRYFIQRMPVISLGNFLHLPLSKSRIIHFLLGSSFVSPLNCIALLVFGPFAVLEILPLYGAVPAATWLLAVVLTSWSIHWFILWFKQRFEDSQTGLLFVSAVLFLSIVSSYFSFFDLGAFFEPVFTFALESPVPVFLLLTVGILSYFLCFAFYRQNAYLDELSTGDHLQFADRDLGFLSRFGLAGEVANLEWKLIMRHKKSRTYLTLCLVFLLYGLIFYGNPSYQVESGFSKVYIFVGTFITGIFMIQYGQLFLSWNSPAFDFYVHQRDGLRALVHGKYLLFASISLLCFILSVPYVYFGWHVLLIHLATFLFNLGVTMHLVIYLALWKPKPMDLNKGSMFNFEGVGISQVLVILPLLVAPYAVFLPFSYWFNDYVGLAALGTAGTFGLLVFRRISSLMTDRVIQMKYEIASAFRQEL
ncbi:hypothetical protein SAMN05192553_103760 [Cyclobacterium xiamenense]|uniref:ABC-2 type transport system permease protein n=1 Tax=Cyclobacterium xiamenense TaxID=1297121 RepID=A0A1H6YLJ9_9BACT|nr:DUF5687 family protein [Cyclobacterium xiamenense]SEJ41266.1 hypothetical protein SAMN05192553_103760 [Cyclobacterium xiamenense]